MTTNLIEYKAKLRDSFSEQSLGKVSGKSVGKVAEKNEKILKLIENNPKITIPEIAENLGVSSRTIERAVGKLQTNNQLQRVGGRKEGHWEVMND